MRRLLSEPLLHFLVLGVLLFILYGRRGPTLAGEPETVVVAAGDVENLALTFERTWQRPATAEELKGLVDDFVREEILSREAVRLGLDRNDTVIRRRLSQKMEFVAEDLAATIEPTEEELEARVAAHPEEYREEARTSFRHVFLGEERGERLEADATELLARLRAIGPEADVSALGDRLLLPGEFRLETRARLAAQLGEEFAAALDGAPVGAWSGPLPSAYGLHLVLVTERAGGGLPPLAEIRDGVRRDVLAERRARMQREFLDALLARYRVEVRWPEEGAEGSR